MTLSLLKRPFFPSFFQDEFETEGERFFTPRANVVENEKNYNVHLELAGVKKEDLDISLQDNILVVKGERKKESESKEDNYSLYESFYGKFERSWKLNNVDETSIEAKFKDGILTLTLPKKKEVIEKEKVRKIAIK